MVTIHGKTAQNFDTLGLGALAPSSCKITEEINGEYELVMEHPYDEWKKWRRVETDRILVASTPRGTQPFRIYNIVPDMDSIKVNARHIFYDLLDNECSPIDFSGTAYGALQAIKGSMAYQMPFEFYSDILISGSVVTERMNPVSALLADGDETTSFVKGFGGELYRDGFNVTAKTALGNDKGVSIRYGKNLVGLEVTENIVDVKTRIKYYGSNGSGNLDSPYINEYVYPKICSLTDDAKTVAELQAEAQAMFDSGLDIPKVNIKVNFVELSKTVEYSKYVSLETVFLGDIVTITNEKMGFSKQARVISYEWNSLLDRYEKIELGDFLPTLAGSVSAGVNSSTLASFAVVNASAVMTSLQSHLQDKNNPHGVTAEQVGTNETVQQVVGSNPNLLDNWYFGNPINQRGQTEYTSEQTIPYTIDRWRIGWNQTATLTEKGVTITSVSGYGEFAQILDEEVSDFIEGREVTLSVLTVTGHLFESTGIVTNGGIIGSIMRVGGWGGYSSVFSIAQQNLEPLLAVKLELGSQQTLARQENGVWVLNDPPPNKALELAKCQRYFVRLGDGFYTGFSNGSGAIISFAVQLPVTMRSTPVISNAVFATVRGLGQSYSLPSSYTTSIFSGSAILLDANMSTAVSASNLFNARITQIDISADL